MPIYVYQVLEANGERGECFEIEQSMHDAPLTTHPVTNQEITRVYLPPNLGLKHSPNTIKNKLDPKYTEKAGFTRYERDKLSGNYYKVSGQNPQAPNMINPE